METMYEYLRKFKVVQVYLFNEDAQVYVRSDPGAGFFARFPGKEEFSIRANTDTVTMAIDGRKEISKEEYEKA